MGDNTPTKQALLLDLSTGLISSTTIVSVLYTLSFILYFLCACLSYSQFRRPGAEKQRTISTFIFASVVFICATMDVALNNEWARILFVDFSSLPGGPIGPSAQAHASVILHILTIPDLMGQFLVPGVLLWRVWVIYRGTRFAIPITILASLLYLANVVSNTLEVALVWAPLASYLTNITRTLDIAAELSLSLSAASTAFMTLLIATRLILVRRKHIKLMGKTDIADRYWGIAAMLIESFALSTAWSMGDLISYVMKNSPAHNFFNPAAQQAEFLAYFLVLYRVFSGRAWDRRTETKLSTMRWDHGDGETSDDGSSVGIV